MLQWYAKNLHQSTQYMNFSFKKNWQIQSREIETDDIKYNYYDIEKIVII